MKTTHLNIIQNKNGWTVDVHENNGAGYMAIASCLYVFTDMSALLEFIKDKMTIEQEGEKMNNYPYYWRVKTRLPERYGQPCRVLARGKMNNALVEFQDGYKVVTSRNYFRKINKEVEKE